MTYSPIMIIHICGGIIAVLAGTTALVVRKGSLLHRNTGKVFVISMLFMSSGGAYMAFMKSQRMNVLAGVFTFYLVATAWLTVMRSGKMTVLLERGLLLVALAAGATGLFFGWEATNRAPGSKGGGPAVAFFIFATLALLSAVGDIRMLVRGGVSGAKRLVRHLWRMGFALFVASGSFFLGTAGDPVMRRSGLRAQLFSKALRHTHLPDLPVLLVVVLTIYWLCRVLFAKAYRKTSTIDPVHD